MRTALVAAAAAALACAHAPARTGAAAEWDKLVDDYLAFRAAEQPTWASAMGLHEHDAELEDVSRAAMQARIAKTKELLARIERVDAAALPLQDRVDVRALANSLRAALFSLEVRRDWERNPMMYAGLPARSANTLIKREYAPPAQRLRSAIARLKATPRIFHAARENVQHPARVHTEVALQIAQGGKAFFRKTLADWGKQAAAGDAALAAEFDAALAGASGALDAFAEWLKSDLLPRSDGEFALGEKDFLEKLRLEEMIDLPLADLRARGEARLEKDHAALVALAAQLYPGKTPHEAIEAMSAGHPSPEELIPAVAKSVEAARAFVKQKGLITFPSEERVRVRETPPFARAQGFASMDAPGAFETSTEAYYYVTPVEPEWDAKHKEEHLKLFSPPVVAMINVHEAYPGHYTQFLYRNRWPTKVRRLIGSGSNSEGWAHYTEQMVVEQGFGDAQTKLAQLTEALVRDCRYVAAVGLHTGGMSVDDATKLFMEKAFLTRAVAASEARRGTFNPTYLYYTLGKILIQDFAAEYRKKTGAGLREFHDAFVSQGALPIPLVRELMLNGR